uniref:Uncharacterized protein n=1 Tax=Solanum lycopersicum TaxID=4081 RepID=A0A3Q7EVI0_SOLLC
MTCARIGTDINGSMLEIEQLVDCIILQKLSAESFHSSHPINVINLQPQVVVTVSSLMKGSVIQFLGRVVRPSVKRELINTWNSKLQAQGECTCTHDGELKEGKPFLPLVRDLNKS